MQKTLKVFIVDDSFIVRERLTSILADLPEVEIVGEATGATAAIGAIAELKPDVVILDIHMPDGSGGEQLSGISVLQSIKQNVQSPFVVMLSNYHYSQYRDRCMEAGADVFLHKAREFDKVVDVLQQLMQPAGIDMSEATSTDSTVAEDRTAAAGSTPQTRGQESAAAVAVSVEVKPLPAEIKSIMRVPYALRRVPLEDFATLLPRPDAVQAGDIVLGRLEKMGRNTRLELTSGRNCNLHEGDLMAVVFGNRYATEQFEGYAEIDGPLCDVLSMGGLCGLVRSKHAGIPDPSRLRVLGRLGDANGRPLRLRDYALPRLASTRSPRTIVVCGTSMDSGKTYTAFSLIFGLATHGHGVAAYKLTGTAAGRDTWSMLDAGAQPAMDFIDGGWASTYLCSLEELLAIHSLLSTHAADQGADWVIIEIADGLLQAETSALLQEPRFTSTVDAWVFAAGDPLAATGGVSVLRGWGIEPIALSGRFTMSPLSIREARAATGLSCLTDRKIQYGDLNEQLIDAVGGLGATGSPRAKDNSRLVEAA